ncbi:MAG: hypothetical protein WD271_02440 [Acidimicrobiia bacterium]
MMMSAVAGTRVATTEVLIVHLLGTHVPLFATSFGDWSFSGNFTTVDLIAASTNALNGALLARRPDHYRNYTVAGILLMAAARPQARGQVATRAAGHRSCPAGRLKGSWPPRRNPACSMTSWLDD